MDSQDRREEQSDGEKREGFTLVEMLMVVVIIGILTAIGFISILHYQQIIRVNTSARELAGHLRVARAQAVRDGQAQVVVFGANAMNGSPYTVGGKTYYLQPSDMWNYYVGNSGTMLPSVPGHANPISSAVDIPTDLSGYSHNTAFAFYSDGTASSTGVAYVGASMSTAAGATGARPDHHRAVDWDATTGRVRVWQFYQSLNGGLGGWQ